MRLVPSGIARTRDVLVALSAREVVVELVLGGEAGVTGVPDFEPAPEGDGNGAIFAVGGALTAVAGSSDGGCDIAARAVAAAGATGGAATTVGADVLPRTVVPPGALAVAGALAVVGAATVTDAVVAACAIAAPGTAVATGAAVTARVPLIAGAVDVTVRVAFVGGAADLTALLLAAAAVAPPAFGLGLSEADSRLSSALSNASSAAIR
jgi:hypothetical protein